MAKRSPNVPVITNATIVAQPLNDSSLGSGKADASKPAAGNPGTSANESPAKTEENPAPSGNPAATAAPAGAAAPEAKTADNQASAKTDAAKDKSTSQDQPASATPQKKKSKFHVLKKIVPF